MFNNVALDIAIGLIFIFLLYSLLAAAINELISMIFAYRHRMLEKGIEQMLDGKNYSYYWWDKVANFILWLDLKSIHWEHSLKRKISKKNADKTLPDINTKDFFKTCNINPANKEQDPLPIRRVKLNQKAALFASNITNHPLYRRKSEASLLYKKPAYLSATAFSDILIDVLADRRTQVSSHPVLMNDIKNFVDTQLEHNPDLKSILNLYIVQANGDLQRLKLILEDWYNDTMDRVSGWYKRQAYKVLMLIGLLLAVILNVSTIEIANKLSIDKAAREAMVQNASAYVQSHYLDGQGKVIRTGNTAGAPGGNASQPANPNVKTETPNGALTDTTSHPAGKDSSSEMQQAGGDLKNLKEKINEIKALYQDEIDAHTNLLGLGWGDYGYTKDTIDFKKTTGLKSFKNFLEGTEKIPDSTDNNRKLQNPQPAGLLQKAGYVLFHTFSDWRKLLGFCITALAISLGAPFWFDLLNKFVNLRAGGRKPDDQENKTVSHKTLLLNRKPHPNSFG